MKLKVALAIPAMILAIIVYSFILLFTPVFWLGIIFWKGDTLRVMLAYWYKKVPQIP